MFTAGSQVLGYVGRSRFNGCRSWSPLASANHVFIPSSGTSQINRPHLGSRLPVGSVGTLWPLWASVFLNVPFPLYSLWRRNWSGDLPGLQSRRFGPSRVEWWVRLPHASAKFAKISQSHGKRNLKSFGEVSRCVLEEPVPEPVEQVEACPKSA